MFAALSRRDQINDRLEFPLELDMFPYTKEGRAAAVAAQSASEEYADDIAVDDPPEVRRCEVWAVYSAFLHRGVCPFTAYPGLRFTTSM